MSNEFVDKEANRFLVFGIIFLVITNICSLAYIGYDKFFSKKNLSKEEEVIINNKVDYSRELTASEVFNLEEKIKVYNKYFYNHFLLKKGEISNKEYLFFAYTYLVTNNYDINVENVNNILEKYFGSNGKYTLDDIYCTIDNQLLYKFDKEKNLFEKVEHPGHGGAYYASSVIKYVSSSVNGNKISMKTKVLYERTCSDVCNEMNAYFKSIDDSYNNKNVILGDLDSEKPFVLNDKSFKSVEDSLPVTIYNFVITNDNNIILDSVIFE